MQKAESATLYKKQWRAGVEQWSGLWLMAADAVPEDEYMRLHSRVHSLQVELGGANQGTEQEHFQHRLKKHIEVVAMRGSERSVVRHGEKPPAGPSRPGLQR